MTRGAEGASMKKLAKQVPNLIHPGLFENFMIEIFPVIIAFSGVNIDPAPLRILSSA
jgi:hypothetical protein